MRWSKKTKSRMWRLKGQCDEGRRFFKPLKRTLFIREMKTMAKTRDALKIIDHMIGDDVELRHMIAEESLNVTVAQMIYDARTSAGLTQQELAQLAGTKQPVFPLLGVGRYQGPTLNLPCAMT